MACNFTVYDIFLHYTNGSYTLVNKTTASGATAAYATYPLCNGPISMDDIDTTFPILPRLADVLVDMNPPAANFSAAFSPDVARLLMGFSAGVFQSVPAAQVMKNGIVARYSLIALAIYLGNTISMTIYGRSTWMRRG
ncbi:hypothetical protein FIBSPDRAFT_955545 [Athelia psychrophila]|uniref:Uncharacterized protein n=1 Tax=Athelia psychrophila TaxID=1759441 RepID=A0A166HU10_9AGAM|nr:hypothetical protein FIBSPDRAFT_955545 [Fibularhizoctonia sp. CBS 109695]